MRTSVTINSNDEHVIAQSRTAKSPLTWSLTPSAPLSVLLKTRQHGPCARMTRITLGKDSTFFFLGEGEVEVDEEVSE